MRVIAGTLKGRRLGAPTWEGLRPTADRLRETLFNVLAPRVPGARVLDVCAGTGALGIEALSRGASFVGFVESDRRAQALIAANLAACGIRDACAIIHAPAPQAYHTIRSSPSFVPFAIILIDPPYGQPAETALEGVDKLLAPGGVVVFEHARRSSSPDAAGRLRRTRDLVSGDSALAFYT